MLFVRARCFRSAVCLSRCSRGTISHCHFLTPVRRKRSPFFWEKIVVKPRTHGCMYVWANRHPITFKVYAITKEGRGRAVLFCANALLRFGFLCDKHRLANFPAEHNTFPHVPPGGGICRCFSLCLFFFSLPNLKHHPMQVHGF